MSTPGSISASPASVRTGVIYGAAAYLFWGLVPLFFKLLSHVAPAAVLSHRIVWSMLVLTAMLTLSGGWREVRQITRDARSLGILFAATLLLATNWFVFIFAITNNLALQASLGYFINPLVNVAFGAIFLGERFRKPQLAGIALATLGVILLTYSRGGLPWVALILAFSWGGYGLLRKNVPAIGPVPGLSVETAMLVPVAAGYLIYQARHGGWTPAIDVTNALLATAGLITVVPLLWFGAAARRLRLSTLGILQYLGPTTQFVIAIWVFKEPLRKADLPGFALIWLACLVYAADSYISLRRQRSAPPPASEMQLVPAD